MNDKIVLDFGRIVSDMQEKDVKLLFVKDRSWFVTDENKDLFAIEKYWHSTYLDKLIGQGCVVSFEKSNADLSKISDSDIEIWDIDRVQQFIENVVQVEYPNIKKTTFVLCMAATKEEYINSNPSETYELNSLPDCISECAVLREAAKAKGCPDYFGAYVVAEDGSNPWTQIFNDLKLTGECFWLPLSDDKCISVWYSHDKQYGDELALKLEQRASDGSMGPHCEVLIDERYTTSDLSYASIRKTLQEIYQDADLSVGESNLHSLTEKIRSVFSLNPPSLDQQIKLAQSKYMTQISGDNTLSIGHVR